MKKGIAFLLTGLIAAATCSADDYKREFSKAESLLRVSPGDAAAVYERALELTENEAERVNAAHGMALSRIFAGDMEAGLQSMRDVMDKNDIQGTARATEWLKLGDALMTAHDYLDARTVYRQIMAVSGHVGAHIVARAWNGVGLSEYALGNFNAAIEAYEQALALESVAPMHVQDAWKGLLDCLMAQQEYEQARMVCARAQEAESADDQAKQYASLCLAKAYEAEGLYPEALTVYLEYIATQNDRFADFEVVERVDVLFRRQLQKAEALMDAGELEQARHAYLRVPEMERVEAHHVARAMLGTAQCLEKAGDTVKARVEYARVLAMPGVHWPDRGRAQMGIARCLEAEGKENEARKAYTQLLEMKNISRFDRAAAEQALQ